MKRKPKPRASATPAPSLTHADILMRSRGICYSLQGAGRKLDRLAIEAITSGRHGAAGEAFAGRILTDVAAGAELDAAIVAALQARPATGGGVE